MDALIFNPLQGAVAAAPSVAPDAAPTDGSVAGIDFAALLAHLEKHGQITPLEWKDIVGASRKYSIPLAEHFDAEKLTLRVGEIRKLRGR